MSELRFLIHNDADAVRFELAGTLSGVDVERVYQVWQREAFNDALKSVIVDITPVTDADQHGRALLLIMHRFGAQIVAKTPESWMIAQTVVAAGSAVSKQSWFERLVGYFRERPKATFPLQAEMIYRASAGHWLAA